MILSIAIIILVITFLNKKGISVGGYKRNYHLKFFIGIVLLGITLQINELFIEYEYLFKDTVEPIIGIVSVYITMAIINRNGLLDNLKINDFAGGLFLVGGVTFLFFIMLFQTI
ncbi:hypothetical protein RYX45_06260 [Alkalihalophilus pseudofirmus]|uniref:Uncharacterized protein n=1 Tax=Alkalihalophilus pseudofirmus TaxID=79885 RepID=A0AAJ2KZG7_ALKPS|nr:hypothetical protein [Alkalihalophilus pseudofirmus]